MMRLEIDVVETNRAVVIALIGDLVFGPECEALSQSIKELLSQGKTSILINLRGLHYIDSSGVGELIASLSSVRKQGGEFRIAEPNDMVDDVFRLTRIQKVLEIYATQEEALAEFS
jgi:anti-sigma B factor antagonist